MATGVVGNIGNRARKRVDLVLKVELGPVTNRLSPQVAQIALPMVHLIQTLAIAT